MDNESKNKLLQIFFAWKISRLLLNICYVTYFFNSSRAKIFIKILRLFEYL